ELVRANVLEARDDVFGRVEINDRIQLRHLVALGVDPADGLLVRDNVAAIELGELRVRYRGHVRWSSNLPLREARREFVKARAPKRLRQPGPAASAARRAGSPAS